MKVGEMVRLAEWCHQAGEIGLIVEVDEYGAVEWNDRQFKILVDGIIRSYHPDDFYLFND